MDFTKLARDIRNYVTTEALANGIIKKAREKHAGWEKRWITRRLAKGLKAPSASEYTAVRNRLPGARNLLSAGSKSYAGNSTLPEVMFSRSLDAAKPVAARAADSVIQPRVNRRVQRLIDSPETTTMTRLLRNIDKKNSYFRGEGLGGVGSAGPTGPATNVFVSGYPDVARGYANSYAHQNLGSRIGELGVPPVMLVGSRSSLLKQYPRLKFTPWERAGASADGPPQERAKRMLNSWWKRQGKTNPAADGLIRKPYTEATIPRALLEQDPSLQTYVIHNAGLRGGPIPRGQDLLTRLTPKTRLALSNIQKLKATAASLEEARLRSMLNNGYNPMRGTGYSPIDFMSARTIDNKLLTKSIQGRNLGGY